MEGIPIFPLLRVSYLNFFKKKSELLEFFCPTICPFRGSNDCLLKYTVFLSSLSGNAFIITKNNLLENII